MSEIKLVDPIGELSEFARMDRELLAKQSLKGERLMRILWDELVGPHSENATYPQGLVDEYYSHPVVQTAYMLTMAEVWSRPERRQMMLDIVRGVLSRLPKMQTVSADAIHILDFGAGSAEILTNISDNLHLASPLLPWRTAFSYIDYDGIRDNYVLTRGGGCLCENWASRFSKIDLREALMAAETDDELFDFVISVGTLEHVPDIRNMTANLVKLVKPGGYALFIVDWVYNADFPMHLPVTAKWRNKWESELMPSLGMVSEGGGFWRKEVKE